LSHTSKQILNFYTSQIEEIHFPHNTSAIIYHLPGELAVGLFVLLIFFQLYFSLNQSVLLKRKDCAPEPVKGCAPEPVFLFFRNSAPSLCTS
jgi:hypothetical protein